MSIDDFYNGYKNKGFKFSDEILTRYAISLATKPFVILSGVSGTGKTKIAQLFEVPNRPAAIRADGDEPNYVLLTVTEGLISADSRANIRYEQLKSVLEENEVRELEQEIESKRESGDGGNIGNPIPLIIESEGEELRAAIYLQRAQSPLARIRFKSKKGDPDEYDSREHFRKNYQIGDVLKLVRIAEHRLRVISNNDKEVIAENERNVQEDVDNKCFIAVKSNWTDSSELFGYYNPLTDKYVTTKLLRFLLLAREHPSVPFFLILDEMNLSKVEHYFSDFLSALESRVESTNGAVIQEGIHLHGGEGDLIRTDDPALEEIEGSIKLPLNLYVTGTVNIDDTTYMFSPKVLDRANVIEFNDIYLEEEPPETDFKLSEFPDFSTLQKSHLGMYQNISQEAQGYIKKILTVLERYNLHFGYRTVAEISHFIVNAKRYVQADDNDLQALDIQIVQKVLPKLHGSYAKLADPLKELIHLLSNTDKAVGEFGAGDIAELNIDNSPFNRSLAKLKRMHGSISTLGFATFIE